MSVFGVSQKTYGWIFAILSVGFIGASQLNNLLLKRFNSQQILRFILICYLVLSILFFLFSQVGWLSLPVVMIFLFGLLACVGIANPNTAALTLAPFDKNAGTASALLGAIQMGLGSLISVFISLFEKPSLTPLAIAFLMSSILAFFMLKFGSRQIKSPVQGSAAVVAGHSQYFTSTILIITFFSTVLPFNHLPINSIF